MKINLYLNKNIEENAGLYFDKAKKAKKKIEGAKEALSKTQKKYDDLVKKQEKEEKKVEKTDRKKQWYEKFRWFYTSDGFLVIGGRDATSNEIVVKKHTDKEDVIFHTEMSGSPFFILKSEGKEISKKALEECANATASYSRAWKLGISSTDVFYVKPDQVSKEAESGEYMSKGAFMIRGKKTFMHAFVKLALGITKDGIFIGGPLEAVKKSAEKYVEIVQGKEKASDIAKKLKKKFNYDDVDEMIRLMPTGGMKIR